MQAGVAVGRICHQAAAPRRHLTAGEEIDARGAETTIGDIAGDDRVAVPAEDNGHGAVAAAWLPYRAAKADVSQQSLFRRRPAGASWRPARTACQVCPHDAAGVTRRALKTPHDGRRIGRQDRRASELAEP